MTEDGANFRRMRLNVLLLSVCQAILYTANSVLIVSAALVGMALASAPIYATVPVAMVFLVGMGCSLPASLLMKRIGRRAGFQIGLVMGITGASLCGFSIVLESFLLFCTGIACIGINNAFGGFYRFAAADVADETYRSRAISYVLAGSVVAAFIGPNMANFTKEVVSGAYFAGTYWGVAVFYVISICLISFLKVPPPSVEEQEKKGRPLRVIASQPTFLIAVVSATVGYGVMNLLMTSTPLAMEVRGMHFGQTAQVIQWHIVAMFAPSFFTGHLVRKFGDLNIILAGVVFLLASVIVSYLFGASFLVFCTALILLGIGWNFTFLGGTTLLTTTYEPSEKAKVQGFNDLCIFSVVSVTALLSGILHHYWGWFVLGAGATVPVLLVAAFVIWHRKNFKAQAAT